MRTHAESVVHMYDATFRVNSIAKDITLRLPASSPLTALSELHRVAQNTHRYGPGDYTVTHLKRDGLSAYDLSPAMANPDVRHAPRTKAGVVNLEMFAPEEMGGIPSASPADAAL